MKKGLNANNSKKIIIGVSILFCTVILIIGGTTAYFTQSGIGKTGNVVTTNINGTIGFTNNNDYMRNNLIPVNEDDVLLFATTNSNNSSGKYTNEDICKYKDNMYACSLYEFTIKNDADVTQEMRVTLNPEPNEFANLHYLVYASEQLKLSTDSPVAKTATLIDKENASTMIESVTLIPEESKTYTVVFYIKNLEDIDQTSVDAGKNFGAIVRVDSITTGEFEIETAGTTCYDEPELITEGDYAGGYRLTKFNGLVDEKGDPKTSCGVIESNGFYSVTIPSEVGGVPITALSSDLFNAIELTIVDEAPIFNINEYSKINNVVVSGGIKTIENGDLYSYKGTFGGLGVKEIGNNGLVYYDVSVTITLPDSLEIIGDVAFLASKIDKIKIPSSVTKIGNYSFSSKNLTSLEFEGASDGTSNLKIIGDYAFESCNITTDKDNPLRIPGSVIYIGDGAFSYNYNLSKLIFGGTPTEITDDNELTIGEHAFYGDGLDYSGSNELVLPARIKSIGYDAFDGNQSDPIITSLKNIRYMGDRNRLDTLLGTNWYDSDVTVKAYGE